MAITYNATDNITTLTASVWIWDSWANAYTFDDILTAFPSAWTKQGDNSYNITSRLYFGSNVYFKSVNELVEIKTNPINPTYVIQSVSTSHIMIGEYDEVNQYSSNGSAWRMYLNSVSWVQSNGNRIWGEFLVYGSNFWTDTIHYTKWIQLIDSAKVRYYDSTFKYSGYFWAIDTDVRNVTWLSWGGIYDMLLARGYAFNWTWLKTAWWRNGVFFSASTNGNVDLYNYAFLYRTTSIDINSSTWNSYLLRFIDWTPTLPTCSSIASGKPWVQICNTFNIKATNIDKSPIVWASVILKDKDWVEVLNWVTQADWTLSNDVIVKNYWYRHADQWGNTDFKTHTLTVTNGFNTTEFQIDIDHKINQDVVILPQPIATMDEILNEIQSLNNISTNDVWNAQTSGITLPWSIWENLKSIKGAEDKDLTEVFNNSPTIDTIADAVDTKITESHWEGPYNRVTSFGGPSIKQIKDTIKEFIEELEKKNKDIITKLEDGGNTSFADMKKYLTEIKANLKDVKTKIPWESLAKETLIRIKSIEKYVQKEKNKDLEQEILLDELRLATKELQSMIEEEDRMHEELREFITFLK